MLENLSFKQIFFLNCFGGPEAPFCIYSPLPLSLQWNTIPDGSPSKDWQSTVGWEDSRI
jgi:hypothetical protein